MMRTIGAVLALALSLPVLGAGDPAAGEQKSQVCAACHGPGGQSANPIWPHLAGQHAEYTAKQLHDFKAGRRKNEQMSPMAAPLSEQDIADLAAYFASRRPPSGTATPELVELGERLYRAGNPATGLPACMACHGPNGAGNPAAGYPRVSGQHAEYAAAQLRAFKSEARANDQNSIMRTIAARMTNKEIEAVADYMQGLY
jgi:cytochrome c553